MPKRKKRLPASELSGLCMQLALLYEAGMMLDDGLETLAEENGAEDSVYAALCAAVSQSGSLPEALRRTPGIPGYLAEMAAIGEASGRMEEVMRGLSEYYDREARVRAALVDAAAYPLTLGTMLVLIVLVMLWKVLPVFRRVLESMGVGKESAGSALMRLGAAAGWTVVALVGAALLFAAACLILMKTKARGRVKAMLRRLFPGLHRLRAQLSAARTASVLSMLLSGGFPLDDTLRMAPAALEDEEAAAQLEAVRAAMDGGAPFAEALAACGLFEPLHAGMIRMGALSGRDAQVMERIAQDCQQRVEDGVSRAVSLVEPVMIALLAVAVGAILLSVMLPMAGILTSMA